MRGIGDIREGGVEEGTDCGAMCDSYLMLLQNSSTSSQSSWTSDPSQLSHGVVSSLTGRGEVRVSGEGRGGRQSGQRTGTVSLCLFRDC